uniref:Uncharacterized protein n=1 Tax=Molossus molossus TaxID=27622 RepID=A0A7J8JVS7_MOLMO|nr:hypothetical protein HJG59_008010 [Molossus molossus]
MIFWNLEEERIRVNCLESIRDMGSGTFNQGHSQPEATLQGGIQGNNDLALTLPSLIPPAGDLHWPNQPEPESTQSSAYRAAFRQGAGGEGWRVDVERQWHRHTATISKDVSGSEFTSSLPTAYHCFAFPWFHCDPT